MFLSRVFRPRQPGGPVAAGFWLFAALATPAAAAPDDELAPKLPAPAPAVTAPQLRSDSGVSYPQQALDAGFYEVVSVELVVEVDASGNVSAARLQQAGRQAFDEAALSAARQLRFEPARRGEQAVPARIRFRYRFEPPEARLSGRLRDAGSGAPLVGARVTLRFADGGTLEQTSDADGRFELGELPHARLEVEATASGHAPSRTELTLVPGRTTHAEVELELELEAAPARASARAAPAPLEVLVQGERRAPSVTSFTRAEVRTLPGAFGDPFRAIEAMPGVTPLVSGLPFFYVRGAPPGNVGYFLDGIRVPFLYHVAIGPSVVQPGLVERVDLYPGGYPARYGRFAGGIVAAEVTEPEATLHGEGNLRLFDVGGLVETPFAAGKGSLLLGGRYSYTAALLSAVAPDVKLDYRDYQLRVGYELGPRDRISVFGFGSYDLLAQKQPGGLRVLFGSEFYRLDLRHDHSFGAGKLRTAVTLGFDQTHTGETGNVQDRSIGVRSELLQPLLPELTLRARVDASMDRYDTRRPLYYDPDDPELETFETNFPARSDFQGGLAADVVWDAAPNVQVTPGARFDVFNSDGATAVAVDPRLAARFQVSDAFAIVHAYGLAHQPPAFVIPIPGLSPANLEDGLQRSAQASAGVELKLDSATTATVSAFYNAFFKMSDAFSATGDGPPDERLRQRSLGSAVGLELFLRRRMTGRLGGFLSYTLSRSTRSIGRERFPATFDRTHVANAALAYQLGRGWQAGARGVFYTGVPKVLDAVGTLTTLRSEHPARTAPFFRLDLRLEKRWTLGAQRHLSFVAEVMNATLSKEQFGDETIGPLTIPSVGLEAGF